MILTAENIKKDFIRQREGSNVLEAVREISLTLEPGCFTVLEGYSGSGKSTLLNMLAGLLAPTAGRVLCDGEDLYALDDAHLSRLRNRHFGIIPQGQSALHALTVRENILLPVTISGGKITADELGLPVTSTGLMLPCGASGRWER